MKRLTELALLCVAVVVTGCATHHGPLVPYTQTPGFHAIGASVYGILEKDLNGDGLPDVVVVRQEGKGYRLDVMERRDPGGVKWSKGCATDPIKGEDMEQLSWIGDPAGKQLVMLVVGEENPEEIVQHFVVVNPDGCSVEWADMLAVPRRDNPVMRSNAMPPEGLSMAADGNALRLIDRTELVGLQGQEGPVSLLARYRERLGTLQDGHLAVEEKTQAVLRKRVIKITWEPQEPAQPATDGNVTQAGASNPNDASMVHLDNLNVMNKPAASGPRPMDELADGQDDTAFAVRPGESGRLTIDSEEPIVLLELHHGCDLGDGAGLTLSHSGRTYTTGTAPSDHAPFRAAGRRHPREKSYTQELLALHDALHAITLDLAPSDAVRCLREVAAYGWQ